MTYPPYEPGPPERETPDGASPSPRDYAPPATPWPPPSQSSSTVGLSVAAALVLFGVIVVVVIAVVSSTAARDRRHQPDPSYPSYQGSTYARCAAEHDDSDVLFTDAQWCDLALNGGNGNGLPDER